MAEIKRIFGVDYFVYVIEFQKRGLPHAHIVFKVSMYAFVTTPSSPIFQQLRRNLNIEDIDSIVSARIPAHPGRLRDLVLAHMIHSRDHLTKQPPARCNKNGRCCWDFPHSPCEYTQLNAKQGIDHARGPGDEWVATYSPALLLLWEGHLHVQAIFTVDVFLYIYKYLFKGPDHASVMIRQGHHPSDRPDAVEDYIQTRYISTPEACWRIFGFNISQQQPSVARLLVHAPNQNRPRYRVGAAASDTSDASKLIRYFMRPSGEMFDSMLFTTYFTDFTLYPLPADLTLLTPGEWWLESLLQPHIPRKIVRRRQRGEKVARIQSVRPSAGEAFYIRLLLFHHPARSFEDLRTIDHTTFESFQRAAQAAGLLQESEEARLAMEDAITSFKSPGQLRFLFTLLIVEGAPALDLWQQFSDDLSWDYARFRPRPIEETLRRHAHHRALCDIDRLLRDRGLSNSDCGLPIIATLSVEIQSELDYFAPHAAVLQAEVNAAVSLMSPDQRAMYDTIDREIYGPTPTNPTARMHFVTGKAGRGKSFIVKAIISRA